MPKLRISHRISLVFLSICLLILAGIAVVIVTPVPVTVSDTVGEATVRFETDNARLFSEADCYTVSWAVDGIKGVYLNGTGKIGHDSAELCFEEDTHADLQVVFEDDSEKEYRLDIDVIQRQLTFWIALTVAGICFLFSLYFFFVPIIGSRIRDQKALLRTVRRLIVVTILSFVVILGLTEFVLRFYFTNFGSEQDRINYVFTADELQQQTAQFTGTPNVLYVPNPTYEGHNSLGYRGEEFDIKKSDGTYRIVSIGESTTYGFGINVYQAYPYVLQEELQNEYGYTNVEVINGGVIGYTSFEVLTNFQFRILELDPDLIIYYGALNDAESRFEDPGCYNSPSPLYGQTEKLGLWGTEFGELPSSTLYRYLGINLGIMNIPTGLEWGFEPVPVAKQCRTEQDYTQEELLELNQPHFAERNFRNLLALADYHDIDVMVSEFIHPTTLEQVEGDKNLLMTPAQAQAVEEIDTLYRDIAEEFDAHYYMMGDDFVIEPGDFWTIVHMRADGAEKQGELYAKFLHDNNIIPSPETN